MQAKRPTVYFSNKLEILGEALGQELWHPKANPFVSKLIILPHHGLKSYLHRFFASYTQSHIAMGLDCQVLMEAILGLVKMPWVFPSELALSFAIEKQLQNIDSDEIFSSLTEYLKKQKSPQAFSWLISEMAKLFYEYAVFEPKLLHKWRTKNGWQQKIWERIFPQDSKWRPLSDALALCPCEKIEIHLFGFSHIPSHLYDFFSLFEPKWYFLSPSEMFWEDLCSDRERIYLEKKMEKGKVRLQVQEQLRFFLTKTHPLLANWGSSGKALLALFGKTECYIEERYEPSTATGALGFLQNSLLELDDEETQLELPLEDSSLLCQSATTPLREVEVLYETLKELNKEPKDVLVLVADLPMYEPYIHMVFGVNTSLFPYCIHGLASRSLLFQVIEHFTSMVQNRFDRESIEKFFSFPLVMRKWGFSEEDIRWLKKEWDKSHIFFGLNSDHKKWCLEKSSSSEICDLEEMASGTWESGMSYILRGLAKEEELFSSPEWTQVDLLSRSMELIKHLQSSSRCVYREEKHPFSFWVDWITNWLLICVGVEEQQEEFLRHLRGVQQEVEEDFLLPFSSFMRAINGFFSKKKHSFQSHLVQAVKFMPLEMGGAYPAKVIYVLGCDGQALPKVSELSSLEDVRDKKEVPSLSDQSRYMFLELILHAKEHLIFSYTRVSPQDQKPQGPCPMIDEMFSYLDKRCILRDKNHAVSEEYTRHHPTFAFSKEYFSSILPYSSFSEEMFALARCYYQKEKIEISPFFPSWHGEEEKRIGDIVTIEIRDLQEFAKHPVRLYFKEKLNMYFSSSFVEDKEFFLPPLLQRKFLTSLKDPYRLPLGRWKELAEKDLEKERGKRKASLEACGIAEEDLITLEWVEGATEIEYLEDRVILPALFIEVENRGSICLKGHITHASSKGLIWFGKKKKDEEYIYLWPTFLLFLCGAKKMGWEEKCWLVEEEKLFEYMPKDPEKELAKYLFLYLRALEEPCPVAPSWALSFLKGDTNSWQEKIKPSSYRMSFIDPYKEWIEIRDPLPSPSHIQKNWQETWREAFTPFCKE
jgi:exodeoxyribonuclease V gamma subunit